MWATGVTPSLFFMSVKENCIKNGHPFNNKIITLLYKHMPCCVMIMMRYLILCWLWNRVELSSLFHSCISRKTLIQSRFLLVSICPISSTQQPNSHFPFLKDEEVLLHTFFYFLLFIQNLFIFLLALLASNIQPNSACTP